jgi:DMSO/TMAO reductase YedYZ molybdopterin-dependent catalytic subunit
MRISVLVVFAALALFAVAVTESAAQVSAPGGPSTFFRVRGRVEHPKVYRLADLKALPTHTVAVSFQGRRRHAGT